MFTALVTCRMRSVIKLTFPCNTCGILDTLFLRQRTCQGHKAFLHRQRKFQGFEKEVQGLKDPKYCLLQELPRFLELLPVVVLVDNFHSGRIVAVNFKRQDAKRR